MRTGERGTHVNGGRSNPEGEPVLRGKRVRTLGAVEPVERLFPVNTPPSPVRGLDAAGELYSMPMAGMLRGMFAPATTMPSRSICLPISTYKAASAAF